jgi:polyhydroxyalkanoate synthesis regulator phasin
MENLTDTLKKAFYLSVGFVSYAGEQAGDIQNKAQELADDLIRRGEDTTEEATRFFNTFVAQNPTASGNESDKPQKIEILSIEDVESDSSGS